jgi:hypothetical protein
MVGIEGSEKAWRIKSRSPKTITIFYPGGSSPRFAGRSYQFRWDGEGYKRQGQYLTNPQKPKRKSKKAPVQNANIPGTLARLALALEIDIDRGFDFKYWNFKFPKTGKRSRFLCCNAAGDTIYILPTNTLKWDDKYKKGKHRQIVKCANMFGTWQGEPSKNLSILRINQNAMRELGTCDHIIYHSDKWGEQEDYIHNFDSKVRVYAVRPDWAIRDDQPPEIMMLKGSKLKVTARGIEG